MPNPSLDPSIEDQLDSEFERYYNRMAQKKAEVSPQLAENLVNFRRRYPHAPISLIVPVVQTMLSGGRLSEDQAGQLIQQATQTMTMAKELGKKQDALDQNTIFKSIIRPATAGIVSFGDFVTNLAGRAFHSGTGGGQLIPGVYSPYLPKQWEEDIKPALQATHLGIYIDSPELRGNGWMTQKSVEEELGKRTRAYRGTINGKAWTFGRATADVFFTPGTREYNILSGVVDIAAAIAIPAIPGGKLLTTPAKALLGEKVLPNLGIMSLQSLTDWRTGLIDYAKVSDFLNSKSGMKVIERLTTEVNSIDAAMNAFKTADVAFWKNVSEIKDPLEMKKFLIDTLGLEDITRGIGPKNIEDINLSSWDLWKYKNIVQNESNIGRYFSSLAAKNYGREIVPVSGSSAEKANTLRSVRTYLQTAKVDVATKDQLLGRMADALEKSNGDARNMVTELHDVLVAAAEKAGVKPEAVDRLYNRLIEHNATIARNTHGWVDDAGDAFNDENTYLAEGPNGFEMVSSPINTAYFIPEMMKHSITLPDLREVRRVMSPLGWVTGKAGWIKGTEALQGEIRLPVAALDWATYYLFKIPSIISGGFVTRNVTDSAVRISFDPELGGGLFHPIDALNIAAHASFHGDILAQTFKPKTPKFAEQWAAWWRGEMPETYAESLYKMGQKEMAEAVAGSTRELSPVEQYGLYRKHRVFDIVRRSSGKDAFLDGVKTELGTLAADPVAQMLAKGMAGSEVVDYLMNPANRKVVEQLQNMWSNIELYRPDGSSFIGRIAVFNNDAAKTINREAIEKYVDGASKRLQATTGNHQTLIDMIADGGIKNEYGGVTRISDGGKEIDSTIQNIIDDPNVNLKATYKRRRFVRGEADPETKNRLKLAVDIFFGHLYSKREAWLNRSPAFRQFYYSAVSRVLDRLAPGEVARLVGRTESEGLRAVWNDKFWNTTNIFGDTREFDVNWVSRYVGSEDLGRKIMDIADGKFDTAGNLTLEELDAWAKGYALDETKKLFYSASEKSNFADILRIVAPFGSAWAEVLKVYGKKISTDPEFSKRAIVSVRGLENADPDNDGKGFLAKDPATGQLMFYFPYGDEFAPLLMGYSGAVLGGISAGIPGALAGFAGGYGAGKVMEKDMTPGMRVKFGAPLQSLSMGLSFTAPFGPTVQIPAAALLKDKPQFDWVMEKLFPYGERKWQEVIVPNNLQKMYAMLNGPDSNRQYGDLRLEMVKALSTTGRYDLKTQQGQYDLEKDATELAKSLYVISFWSNFAGPVRAAPEAEIQTKNGWVLAGELSKSAYDIRRRNPMGWVSEFLDTHGDNVLMYAQSKTKSEYGGLEVTKEFNDWERKNKRLFEMFPEVAGYFAPIGGDFDFHVYIRQRESGMRKTLTPQEMIDESQKLVGLSMYRAAVRATGGNPNKEQRSILRSYKKELEARYPGFATPYLVQNFDNTVVKLKELVNDPVMAENDTADAVRVYLQARDEALAAAANRGYGLSADKNSDLRGSLRNVGETLSAQIPGFERIWSRLLFNEVDTY